MADQNLMMELMRRRTKMMKAGLPPSLLIVWVTEEEAHRLGYNAKDLPKNYLGVEVRLEPPRKVGPRQMWQEGMNFAG